MAREAETLREQVARVIHPFCFNDDARSSDLAGDHEWKAAVAAAFEKADAVIALLANGAAGAIAQQLVATCAKLADDRAAICFDAADKIEAGELYPDLPRDQNAATERCAGTEARHIAELIRALAAAPEAGGGSH